MIKWVKYSFDSTIEYDCKECTRTYELEQDKPPCGSCAKPRYMSPRNETAFKLWGTCNKLRQSEGPIRMKLSAAEIKSVCDAADADFEDFENVIELEFAAYPFLLRNVCQE